MTGRAGAAVPQPAPGGGRWADLTRRLASTAVLLAIAVLLALSTGIWLRLLISLIVAVTFWELARMTGWRHPAMHVTPFGRGRPLVLSALAGVSLFITLLSGGAPWLLLLPLLAGMPGAIARDRLTYAVFGAAILLVGYGLVHLREALGLGAVLWVMGVVVISDSLGYFAGRMLGGPKFWPRLSPNKTWSGTVAGWVGAALFGALLAWLARGGESLILLSPLVAFAGQMGDIAESWLKRRAGVKDSSNLIPGHGGFMDRFDAVSGAVLMVGALDLAGWLPISA
ncbi:phosphatidate cytidylyltransferase [Paracoccus sp. S-4012]|uniref:phosphatidate cytidylyltransferase n=1 Tax=Paracoccus sp. S-4012 TaxID=2665648 RepID=UPI0012AF45ED|nr:phosphatidate cytidylyltransferase [Paracoccus sp. S-4012]MRX49609.1 phosphatidate cytidylyltransferase [Paracoccus sp. S-4012]